MTKYRATRTIVDGITFASKREAARYAELKLLLRAGEIRDLRLQPRYELQGKQGPLRSAKNGRALYYVADFEYVDRGGALHIEDSKGFETKDFRLKRAIMAAQGLAIEVV